MNMHHLRVFMTVAECGGIGAGAAALHISQPAVTREIRELEARLGLALFDRLPRGVRITEAGERLLQYARRIFALEQAAEQELRGFADLALGDLRLGASATLGAYLLPAWIDTFARTHPTLRVELQVSNTQQVVEALEHGRVALGFVEGPFAREAYEHRLLAVDPLLPLVGPGHPLAGREDLRAADLDGQPLFLREEGSGTRATLEAVYREHGLRLDARMAVASSEALKRLVAGGRGIAWLSPLMVAGELARGELLRLPLADLRVSRELHAVWRGGERLSPAPAAFLEQAMALSANIKTF